MKTFTQFTEDGMGGGGIATSTAGLGSVVDKQGIAQSPPVFRKRKITPVMGLLKRKTI
jgi:hypothetical protein